MLVRALIVLIPVLGLLAWSLAAFGRSRARALRLQIAGACCLLVVVVAHVFEARQMFGFMGWGERHSPGHYLDLSAAILGLTLIAAAGVTHVWVSRSGRRSAQ